MSISKREKELKRQRILKKSRFKERLHHDTYLYMKRHNSLIGWLKDKRISKAIKGGAKQIMMPVTDLKGIPIPWSKWRLALDKLLSPINYLIDYAKNLLRPLRERNSPEYPYWWDDAIKGNLSSKSIPKSWPIDRDEKGDPPGDSGLV